VIAPCNSRRQTGFTLVELIACLVVLGVIAAIAAPNFFDHQTFVARGYADDLASSLRYARRIAVASSCNVRLTIDAAGYSAWQQESCNSGAWTTPVLRPDGTRLDGITPTDVNIAAPTAVEYLDDGAAATGATTIAVGTHIVSVDGPTGRVSVQ
jgi:MSHA pilin protein MshC